MEAIANIWAWASPGVGKLTAAHVAHLQNTGNSQESLGETRSIVMMICNMPRSAFASFSVWAPVCLIFAKAEFLHGQEKSQPKKIANEKLPKACSCDLMLKSLAPSFE